MSGDGRFGVNTSFFYPPEGEEFLLEAAGWWREAMGWKLWPVAQKRGRLARGAWLRMRVDVGRQVANVYLGGAPEPAFTIYDLPRSHGGIRLMTYAGSACFRNLRVVELAPRRRSPCWTIPGEPCGRMASSAAGRTRSRWNPDTATCR